MWLCDVKGTWNHIKIHPLFTAPLLLYSNRSRSENRYDSFCLVAVIVFIFSVDSALFGCVRLFVMFDWLFFPTIFSLLSLFVFVSVFFFSIICNTFLTIFHHFSISVFILVHFLLLPLSFETLVWSVYTHCIIMYGLLAVSNLPILFHCAVFYLGHDYNNTHECFGKQKQLNFLPELAALRSIEADFCACVCVWKAFIHLWIPFKAQWENVIFEMRFFTFPLCEVSTEAKEQNDFTMIGISVFQWKCLCKKGAFKFDALFGEESIHVDSLLFDYVILRYGITRFCYFPFSLSFFVCVYACTCSSLNVVCFSIPVMHSKLEHTTCIGTIKLMIQQSIVYIRIYTLPTAICKKKWTGTPPRVWVK